MLNLDEFYNRPCDNVLIVLHDPQTCDEGRLMVESLSKCLEWRPSRTRIEKHCSTWPHIIYLKTSKHGALTSENVSVKGELFYRDAAVFTLFHFLHSGKNRLHV